MIAGLVVMDTLSFSVGLAVDLASWGVAQGFRYTGKGLLQAGVHLSARTWLEVASFQTDVLRLLTVSSQAGIVQKVVASLLRTDADARVVCFALLTLNC